MSVEPIHDNTTGLDEDDRIREVSVIDVTSPVVDGELPQVVATDVPVEALLLSTAHGDQAAFVALQSRMAGLVRVNVRRVLRDASRADAVTKETFADVRGEAIHFDPYRDNAQTWLLTRAHQHAVEGLQAADEAEDPISRCNQSEMASLA